MKTNRVAEKIRLLLEKIPGIEYAFIHGPYAKDPENRESDIDVMVVGGPDLAEMNEALAKAGVELGRNIYTNLFTVREWRERIEVKHESVLEALEGPRIMLIGHEKKMLGISNANCWQSNAA